MKLFQSYQDNFAMCASCVCVNAGSAAVEERRRPRLQHLHGDSGGKRGAGRLGPEDFPLPRSAASGEWRLTPERTSSERCWATLRNDNSCTSSGAARWRRRHAGSRAGTRAAAPPPEVQPRAELGPGGERRRPPLSSRHGHHWLLYRQLPEELRPGGGGMF